MRIILKYSEDRTLIDPLFTIQEEKILSTIIEKRYIGNEVPPPKNEGTTAWWFASGQNHKFEDGYISREFPEVKTIYFIELNNLDTQLLLLLKLGKNVKFLPASEDGFDARVELWKD